MNGALRLCFAAGTLALAARVIAGCADTEGSDPGLETPREDASNTAPPESDADPSDGGDGGTTDGEASPRTCSEDGFCYADLPTPDAYDASTINPSFLGVTFPLRAVWGASAERVWAVSADGHILRWDGTSWHVEAIAARPLHTVWGASADDVWFGGERGLILHGTYENGALSLETVTTGTTQTILRIAGTSENDVWASVDPNGSGNRNRLFRYRAGDDGGAPSFVATTVPGLYPFNDVTLRVQALWTAGTDLWFAAYETSRCGGATPCSFRNHHVAAKREPLEDGGSSWTRVELLQGTDIEIVWGASTTDGIQLAALPVESFLGSVLRLADDETKLDASTEGGITISGDHAFTNELAVTYGHPTGLWATNQNDIWLVGKSGVVRHFDGNGWQLVRVAISERTPLLKDLYAINAVPLPGGGHELWIVGDDVTIRKRMTVSP